MNKIFGLLLLALVSFDSNAQNKVRGELRTEINGFQWYCYKGKEAFSVDGRSLFNDFKNVQSISFSAADKNDKGFFIVQNKTNGLYYTTALDPYTYNTMIRHCGGKELYNMYSVAMVFSNPQHKEYYVKSVHPRYTSSLYYPPSNKEILSNNFTIKDNYIITDGAYTGASRYDGKIITKEIYYDRVTYQEEAKHFICDVYSPSKSIKIVDTLGVTLANNIKSAKYKGGDY